MTTHVFVVAHGETLEVLRLSPSRRRRFLRAAQWLGTPVEAQPESLTLSAFDLDLVLHEVQEMTR